jgi:hypothetical protein
LAEVDGSTLGELGLLGAGGAPAQLLPGPPRHQSHADSQAEQRPNGRRPLGLRLRRLVPDHRLIPEAAKRGQHVGIGLLFPLLGIRGVLKVPLHRRLIGREALVAGLLPKGSCDPVELGLELVLGLLDLVDSLPGPLAQRPLVGARHQLGQVLGAFGGSVENPDGDEVCVPSRLDAQAALELALGDRALAHGHRLRQHGGGVEPLHVVAEDPVRVGVAVGVDGLRYEQLQGRLVPLRLAGRPPVGGEHAEQHRKRDQPLVAEQ